MAAQPDSHLAGLASWTWGQEVLQALLTRHALAAPRALLDRLDRRLRDHAPGA